MKAQIDNKGHLFVERAGEMKVQGCPFGGMVDGNHAACGDWCPLFEENVYREFDGIWSDRRIDPNPPKPHIYLNVVMRCSFGMQEFKDVTDLRGQE